MCDKKVFFVVKYEIVDSSDGYDENSIFFDVYKDKNSILLDIKKHFYDIYKTYYLERNKIVSKTEYKKTTKKIENCNNLDEIKVLIYDILDNDYDMVNYEWEINSYDYDNL